MRPKFGIFLKIHKAFWFTALPKGLIYSKGPNFFFKSEIFGQAKS